MLSSHQITPSSQSSIPKTSIKLYIPFSKYNYIHILITIYLENFSHVPKNQAEPIVLHEKQRQKKTLTITNKTNQNLTDNSKNITQIPPATPQNEFPTTPPNKRSSHL